jgi:cytochrome c biogenesis protein CcdA/thiol-disulfide isomerase/thioredoxin
MQADLITIALGFLEGLALIVSPCILPILPIILAGSLTGSKKRPVGIICGFILVFSLFTFFSRQLVQYSGIDLNLIRHVSYGVLLLLGVLMSSTYLTEKFNVMTISLMNTGASFSSANNPEGGWISGVLFGGLTAIIWTPCAGPILAAVIVQTVIQQSNVMGLITLFAFGTGVAIPMLIIALFGRQLLSRFDFLKKRASLFRKLLGIMVILSVFFMISLESGINLSPAKTLNTTSTTLNLQNGLITSYPAPELIGLSAWINSTPLQLSELRGKVVLIDFWTYSCINCIRTLPYLKAWYEKYHDKGLVIIGIHTPEFDFEKDIENVKRAVIQDGIKYPVALDDRFQTWQNYHNQYWPAHYLIDKNGNVVYTHFGEGEYDTTENNIRYLLNDTSASNTIITEERLSSNQTPETYLGYARADHFKNDAAPLYDQVATYHFPETLAQNEWALNGKWEIMADRIVSKDKAAALKIHFHASHVYIVMGNATNAAIPVTLLLNNQTRSQILVNGHQLYNALHFTHPTEGELEVIAGAPGLEMYTFTFG